MKNIDFDQSGGFPLKQFTTKFMQESYQEIVLAFTDWVRRSASFSAERDDGLNRQILQGLQKKMQGGVEVITPGWIISEKDLLYFAGATSEEVESRGGIGVATVVTPAIFKDGNQHDVYEERYAVAGGVEPLAFSAYRRVASLEDFRPTLSKRFNREVGAIPPGSHATINLDVEGAKVGDAVVVGFSEMLSQDGSPVFFGVNDLIVVRGRVAFDDRLILTLINQHRTLTAFQGMISFQIKIIK